MQHIKQILINYFQIKPKGFEQINGYANTNYLLETNQNKYILKEYIYTQKLYDFLLAENRILDKLNKELPNYFQKPVLTTNKQYLYLKENKIYRVITYIEGNLLANTKHTDELLEDFGKILAKTDLILQDINEAIIKVRQYKWDILNIDLSKKYFHEIHSSHNRKLVEYFYFKFNEKVRHLIPNLRKSIIHADANDYNILVKNNQICGIIDFGDSVYSLLINELAIALVYIMFHKEEPLKYALSFIRGYCKIIPLKNEEIDILYYLIAARLCISISQSAHEKKLKPNDSYITISERPALILLNKWIKINPLTAANTFRKACEK